MHIVTGDGRVLASSYDVADSWPARARGLMFKRSLPDGHALVFPFDAAKHRFIHMAFVPFPLAVVWLDDNRVERVARLRPWIGTGAATADTVIEFPESVAERVEEGDTIRLEPA